MDGKFCVITGASSGVGLAAAQRLHAFGADILMVNRNPERSRAAAREIVAAGGAAADSAGDGVGAGTDGSGGGSVDFLTADFSEIAQTRRVIDQIGSLGRPIDVLINNAGLHMTTPVRTPDGLEMVFAVNHIASFMLTKALIPAMNRNAPSRIIQVNSQGHRFAGLRLDDLDWRKRPYIGLRAYGAAKTAQLLCAWEFADRLGEISLAGSRTTVNAMHPGAVKTNVGNNNGKLYRWFQRAFVWNSLQDVGISGIALHWLAAAPELEQVTGRFFNLTHDEKPAPHALDRELGKKVWDISCEISGMKD
jgi:NAD(P)-dependent dehydrogenase (short-subunit alcohol dehydrogenase family)